MSHIRVGGLEDLQNMLPWPLWADDFFADVGVIDYRAADLESEITRSLGILTEVGGKVGACVIVLPLAASVEFINATGRHPLKARITFRILEDPVLNHSTGGTQKTARMIATRIRQVLQNYKFGAFSSPLVPDAENFIIPIQDPVAPEAYEVMFECLETVDQNFVQCATPVMSYDSVTGLATLTNGAISSDATIYYTIDGTFPFTSAAHPNASCLTYTAPFAIEGEVLVQWAAVRDGFLISSVGHARFDAISDQSGSGGAVADETGSILQQT
jgi:hypothetical protein